MASEFALQKAAQAWCKPKTENKIMDPELAEEFANILDQFRTVQPIAVHGEEDRWAKIFEQVVNCNSLEQFSDTPDFIIGEYLKDCLVAFNKAIKKRVNFYSTPPPSSPSVHKVKVRKAKTNARTV